MARRSVRLLLCLSLILASGPLAPCKLEHALMKWSALSNSKISSRVVVNPKAAAWCAAADQDDDSDCDASCWCSIHMSAQDSAGTSVNVPVVVALLTPTTINLMFIRAEASRPASYALEPPIPISARSLPLLI